MDKFERLQRVKDACLRFLGTYTTESKMSASQPAVMEILEDLHQTLLEHHKECTHPLCLPLKREHTAERYFVAFVDMRDKRFLINEVLKKNASMVFNGLTGGQMFVANMPADQQVTLLELEQKGVSPYEIVQRLQEGVDLSIYEVMSETATMPPAMA